MITHTTFLDTIKWCDLKTVTSNKKISYINAPSAFDIETTSLTHNGDKIALPYIWQFGINDTVCYGRSITDFVDLCNDLSVYYGLSETKRLVVYVHNLAYEFQFIRKYFDFVENGVFSLDERKPLKALTTLGIEFRCSYMLSGYNLEMTAKNLTSTTVKKLVGDLDYSLIRHEHTPLTPDELAYCENDVLIVLAYISEQIAIYGDVINIPLTNTGRVRQFVRDRCYKLDANGNKGSKSQGYKYRKMMKDLTLTPDDYTQLKRAFMGGFTHANANYVNQVLPQVTSIDFTSSYPSVMLAEKYPMTRFKNIEVETVSEFEYMCSKFAVVVDVEFINLRPKITQDNYLSESKCYQLDNPVTNNGRVVSADFVATTIIDTDYWVMKQCYEWDYIQIKNMRYAHKAYLPRAIVNSILSLYQDKTVLKDVKGMEVEYLLSKGMLNSIYGMCVTDVIKENAIYNDEDWYTETPDVDSEIDKYNGSRNRFLYYPWGVWVTGYARANLWSGILAVGDDYVYSDTDSLKLLNYENHLDYINQFNDDIYNKMVDMMNFYGLDVDLLSPKTKDGVTKTMGVWDFEGTYTRFKTLGAKRYMVQDGDKFSLTVAGLGKKQGMDYIKKVCNGDPVKIFDMFNDELYIPADETGKMTHTYIDAIHTLPVTDYLGNTSDIITLSGIHLEPCEYTLSLSERYLKFIENLANGFIYKGYKT